MNGNEKKTETRTVESDTANTTQYGLPLGPMMFAGPSNPIMNPMDTMDNLLKNDILDNANLSAMDKCLQFANVNGCKSDNVLDHMVSSLNTLQGLDMILNIIKPKINSNEYSEITRGIALLFDDLQKMAKRASSK